jgi:hypothetical protein
MRFALTREGVPGTRLESPSQFTAEEHRERARQCLRMAREVTDSASRVLLLEMAQRWMKLARVLECPVDKTENGSDTS